MRMRRKLLAAVLALGLAGAYSASSQAAVPIQFDPDGPGGGPAITVQAFDWMPGNAVVVGGNPAGGLVVGHSVKVLSHARMGALVAPGGAPIALPVLPEFTFIAGFRETVVAADLAAGSASFEFDDTDTSTNFFEIWVGSTLNANNLTGTGFNDKINPGDKRILYGKVTNVTGNFVAGLPIGPLDQSGADNYPGQLSLTGSGSTDISVDVIYIDPDYFPNFTPAMLANLKAFFNTSTVIPFRQNDPSALFVDQESADSGQSPVAPSYAPQLGAVNGGLQTAALLDVQLQADANQSFEPGVEVPGACRVTYGGNDRNGNIDPIKFGEACAADGKKDENCYTFGGQVGAPTVTALKGGPFGEHTHHQVSGPAGDFIFRAGTNSAPKPTRIEAVACWDPGACRPAEANAGFKQIDFEGTGSFRTLSDQARQYLMARAKEKGFIIDVRPDNQDDKVYWFRVDMNDLGEPGSKWSKNGSLRKVATDWFATDQNNNLSTPDPLFPDPKTYCGVSPDTYQFYICPTEAPCEASGAMYAVRGFLTGGNIQLHKVIK